jgi:hypothetical protein
MKWFFLILSSFSPLAAFGAACCGGGFASPSLIAGYDAAELTASYGYTRMADDVGSDSLWRRRREAESFETYKIEGAHVFADRWQAGFSLPLVERSRVDVSKFGLGDIAGTLGFEALPDWDYSSWRPKGLAFLQITAPTGRAVNESTALYQLDSRGRGFWAVGSGFLFTKAWGDLDVFSEWDGHRSFPKDYANSESSGRLTPGWGGNAGGGAGYSWKNLRFGGALTWTYEDPVSVSGTVNSQGTPQRFATATASVSYLASLEWSGSFSYSDQTLFGDPLNTSLGRGAVLMVQRRWQR